MKWLFNYINLQGNVNLNDNVMLLCASQVVKIFKKSIKYR